MSNHSIPAPQVQAFIVCREIWHNTRTGEFMITGPVSHIPVAEFPANIRLSVYGHITGGHGSYRLEFQLRDAVGEVVWSWQPAALLDHPNPLAPQQLAFHELIVNVAKADRYDMVLVAGEQEIAHQPLLIGPSAVFRVSHH